MPRKFSCKYATVSSILFLLIFSCQHDDLREPILEGSVLDSSGQHIIYPAFLIYGEELLATTDENGTFTVTSLEPGSHSLVCSSIGYSDKAFQAQVAMDRSEPQDIFLLPDQSTGEVYGKLNDKELYTEQLKSNPDMADWTDKELFDGVSGATLQSKTFGYPVPSSKIFIGDSLVALTDEYGQYFLEIQAGTYPVRVSAAGYSDTMQVVRIGVEAAVFANFILARD